MKNVISGVELHDHVNKFLEKEREKKVNGLDPCEKSRGCGCASGGNSGAKKIIDLVILIDTSGSMSTKGKAISDAADTALLEIQKKCPQDLRIEWLGLKNGFGGTKFTKSHRDYINGLGLIPAPVYYSQDQSEEGADSVADISKYFDWRKDACRAILYVSDEPLDMGAPQNNNDTLAANQAIGVANSENVSVFTHLAVGGFHNNSQTIQNFMDLANNTGGKAFIGTSSGVEDYMLLLEEVICNGCGKKCKEIEKSEINPCISISWGDSDCDCLETDDYEVLFVNVCSCYSNVTLSNFKIGMIEVVDEHGNPVPLLPNGNPSVELHPVGPYCFGDIGPCVEGKTNCVSREFVLYNKGAKPGKYKINLKGVGFEVKHHYEGDTCFELTLCDS